MSRASQYFVIHNLKYSSVIRVYGKNTVAKYLRDNGCRFNDKQLAVIKGENAIVFNNRDGETFIVEEACADE